jgi:hypothetical protein
MKKFFTCIALCSFFVVHSYAQEKQPVYDVTFENGDKKR